MKKRWIVQRIRLVPEDGKDWSGTRVERVEEITFLCKDGYSKAERDAHLEKVMVAKVWTMEPREVRYFGTEEQAEKTAFLIVVKGDGAIVGQVSVVKVPCKKDPVKARRKRPEKVNVGRWPNSSGRNRRKL